MREDAAVNVSAGETPAVLGRTAPTVKGALLANTADPTALLTNHKFQARYDLGVTGRRYLGRGDGGIGLQ